MVFGGAPRYLIKNYKETVIIYGTILIMTAGFRKHLIADGSFTETCRCLIGRRCLNICQLKMKAGCLELKLHCSVKYTIIIP